MKWLRRAEKLINAHEKKIATKSNIKPTVKKQKISTEQLKRQKRKYLP